MSRTARTLSCLLLALASSMLPASPALAGVRVSASERQQLRLINDYRAEHGLSRLRLDRVLTRAADWMAVDMPRRGYFAHQDSRGRDPFARLEVFGYPDNTWRGENLAAGYADASSTFNQWVNSPAHRDNMLTSEYRAVGISRTCVAGSTYGCYWVTEFGSRVLASLR